MALPAGVSFPVSGFSTQGVTRGLFFFEALYSFFFSYPPKRASRRVVRGISKGTLFCSF